MILIRSPTILLLNVVVILRYLESGLKEPLVYETYVCHRTERYVFQKVLIRHMFTEKSIAVVLGVLIL